MSQKIYFIPSYIALPKDGNPGYTEGYLVDFKKHELKRVSIKIAEDAKIPPFTEKGLQTLQDNGFFLDTVVVPKLGKTVYITHLNEDKAIVKMSYKYTKEQREKLKAQREAECFNTYDDLDDEAVELSELI